MTRPLLPRVAAAVAVIGALVLTGSPAFAAESTAPVPTSVSVVANLPTTTTRVTVVQNGRRFSARLVQPTGTDPGAYPVVAFGHGFVQSADRYASILTSLASHGYIVIAPYSQQGLFPSHSAFADDLAAAADWVRATQPNANPTLDAALGHSMGGGAAVLAASRNPGFDTVATLAAADTRPSAVAAARSITRPALFVVGTSDTVVKPASTRAIYDATPAPATWAAISGGYHCGFLDSSSFFGFGCDRGQISRATQLDITRALLISWLDAQLKGGAAFSAPSGVTVESR